MSLIETLLIALGLATDATAVCLAAGACGFAHRLRSALRIALCFGFFQFLMPVVGWFVGARVAHLIQAFDHWVALLLLGFVGARMIRSGLRAGSECPPDPSRGWTLLALGVATSIDALAVGLSLALLGAPIWRASVTIGVVTALLSLSGIYLGRRLGVVFGKRMEIAGGIVLILIGLRILWMHLR